ncbi:MAG: DUF4349 domain-containing protein [Sandaracinaceae bacterium]|nr:DUF4349 domain-containing protein [Sandaracinaceae bacterium]
MTSTSTSRALGRVALATTLALAPWALACGGGAAYRAQTAAETMSSPGYGGDEGRWGSSGGLATGTAMPEPERAAYAQAEQATTTAVAASASDARDTSGPLLIYTATLTMAVFEVRATQVQLVERARSLGGVLTLQTDDRLVVRVPAARFDEFLSGIGELGDVLHRDIQAQDVGEEFRDVAIRIRNLEVTRQRVEALLAQASNVEQALAVQRELERITAELEALRGRQRYLADRISLSTITFLFQPMPREALEQPEIFRLPFRWLEELGLPTLLEVR